MIVYHGTNVDFEEIDLKKGSRFKDFGRGFYVTPDIETAKRMACKKAKILGGVPTIIGYELEESTLITGDLNVLTFPEKATAEWINFVSNNRDRHSTPTPCNYDVVEGPIADDGVALQLGRLRLHADEAQQIALDLQDRYLDQQFCFRTQLFTHSSQKDLSMRTKIGPSHHAIAILLTDDIISEMTQYLIEDYGYTLEKALDLVYTSHTIELLQIEEGELYVQSPAYVYDMLLQELHLYPVSNEHKDVKVAED